MSENVPEAQVLVYTASNAFEAEAVKAMLAYEEIPSTVENENAPYPGPMSPCKVNVAVEHETAARQLIEVHEAQHRQRLEKEENQSGLMDDDDSFDDDDYTHDTVEFDPIGDDSSEETRI